MTGNAEELELKDRLSLIETMIAEGRRTTASWGWVFVLWGLAYYIAIAWDNWGGHSPWAWPVTMTATFALTAALSMRQVAIRPRTTISRAIASVWIAMGISMFVLFMSLGISGRLADEHGFVAVVAAMLGTANATSGMILKWKMQLACALVWWTLTGYACFAQGKQLTFAYLAAIFFCQIVFGIYGMIMEARMRTQGAVHA
jgi:hypothetical protein